jgi:hypothetical protein
MANSVNNGKYLFHGTSAISVWASYKEAKSVRSLIVSNSKTLCDLTKRLDPKAHLIRFGPTFPYQFPRIKLSLTDKLYTAFTYSREWEMVGSEAQISLICESRENKKFRLSPLYYFQFGSTMYALSRQIEELIMAKKTYRVDGAVLILNKDYLISNSLLSLPKAGESHEESYLVEPLPWSSVYGILFIGKLKGNKLLNLRFWMNDLNENQTRHETMDHDLNRLVNDIYKTEQNIKTMKRIPNLNGIIHPN